MSGDATRTDGREPEGPDEATQVGRVPEQGEPTARLTERPAPSGDPGPTVRLSFDDVEPLPKVETIEGSLDTSERTVARGALDQEDDLYEPGPATQRPGASGVSGVVAAITADGATVSGLSFEQIDDVFAPDGRARAPQSASSAARPDGDGPTLHIDPPDDPTIGLIAREALAGLRRDSGEPLEDVASEDRTMAVVAPPLAGAIDADGTLAERGPRPGTEPSEALEEADDPTLGLEGEAGDESTMGLFDRELAEALRRGESLRSRSQERPETSLGSLIDVPVVVARRARRDETAPPASRSEPPSRGAPPTVEPPPRDDTALPRFPPTEAPGRDGTAPPRPGPARSRGPEPRDQTPPPGDRTPPPRGRPPLELDDDDSIVRPKSLTAPPPTDDQAPAVGAALGVTATFARPMPRALGLGSSTPEQTLEEAPEDPGRPARDNSLLRRIGVPADEPSVSGTAAETPAPGRPPPNRVGLRTGVPGAPRSRPLPPPPVEPEGPGWMWPLAIGMSVLALVVVLLALAFTLHR